MTLESTERRCKIQVHQQTSTTEWVLSCQRCSNPVHQLITKYIQVSLAESVQKRDTRQDSVSADVHICLSALGLQWEESDEGEEYLCLIFYKGSALRAYPVVHLRVTYRTVSGILRALRMKRELMQAKITVLRNKRSSLQSQSHHLRKSHKLSELQFFMLKMIKKIKPVQRNGQRNEQIR